MTVRTPVSYTHLIIEAIRRKPIRRDLEGMVHFAGLVLLMALMVYVMIHDVQRIL